MFKRLVVVTFVVLALSQVAPDAAWDLRVPVSAATTAYFVATDGSDSNPGTTVDSPFRTIQQCADVAHSGDTCTIRAGTYRETVTVPRSGTDGAPITFRPYDGETVVISGADPLSGWTSQGGGRYTTAMPWSLNVRRAFTGEGPQITNNQIFVDGQMMPEARWPNLTPLQQTQQGKCTMAQVDGASVASASAATYYDADLSAVPAGAFNGAKISFAPGDNLIYTTCDVTGQTTGAVSFQCDTAGFDAPGFGEPGTMLGPSTGNYYYLWGTPAALDAPGEWYRDDATGAVTLQMPDGGTPGTRVEARRRLWAFDLRGRSYILLEGLQLFAATIRYDDSTEHTTVQGMEIRYPWHFQDAPPLFWSHGTHGLQVMGQYNVVEDSLLAYSPGSMIALGGTHNQARNNVIYETAYMGISGAVVGSVNAISNPGGTAKNTVSNNTLFISGRLGVAADPGLDITYNDLYRSHLQISDLGTIYSWGTDGKNATIAYNLVHDNDGELNLGIRCFGGHGIYLDDNTTNYQIYRNVVWSTTSPGIFVFGGDAAHTPSNRSILNNTVDGTLTAWAKDGQSLAGTTYRNNIGTVLDLHGAGLTADHNLEGEGGYVDRSARDYRLRHDSPAVDAGVDLGSPVMDAPMAPVDAPDLGALEHGRTPFVAGALLREQDLAALTVDCEQTSDSLATCTLEALPVGRKAPEDLQVRIGSSGAVGQGCSTQMDYTAHRGVAICEAVPTNGLSGTQALYVRLGDGDWVARGSIDLGPLALTTVVPDSGISAGGTRATLHGRRFDTTIASYQVPLYLTNDSGTALYGYQVPVTLDTAALIGAGKLRGDCGDLRFIDAYGALDYWLESGCNTTATRVWFKVPVIPTGSSTLTMTYGNPALSSASSGAQTFVFFDDFEDGVLDADIWRGESSGAVMVSESGGALRIAGQTDDGDKYAAFGAYLEETTFAYPDSFAIDARLSVLSGPAGFKANVGAADSVLALQGAPGGSPLGKAIAYYAGGWQAVGSSGVGTATFDRVSFSVGYTGAEANRTVRWMEDGGAVRATRSGIAYPERGYFNYGPDSVSSFDACFDDVRVRAFVFPEPAVALGAESAPGVTVTFGGTACRNIVVEGPARLTCTVPAHPEGSVDVVVRNPGGESTTLASGFVYVSTYEVFLPVVMRGK